jgi:hypothetical protein
MGEEISQIQKRLADGAPYKAKLEEAVALWPTPMAKGCGGSGHWQMIEKKYSEGKITHEEKMAFQAGPRNIGKLNPEWVGWLMGFPPGWINLEDSETPSSLKSPNSSEG